MIRETNRSGRAFPLGMFVGIAAASVMLAPSASADAHYEQYIEVPQCTPATGQECPQAPEVNFTADQNQFTTPTFTGNSNGCSDALIRFHNDKYPVSDWIRVSPGQTISSGGFYTKSGPHVLSVRAKGIEGGCNTGILNAWGGVVTLDARPADPQPSPTPTSVPDQPFCPPFIPADFCR